MKKCCAVLAFTLLLLSLATFSLASFAEEKISDLQFVVVKEETGKPVRNASVILHAVNKNGKQEKAGLQLKTDSDGKASFSGIPYGKLRIQVLASGLQTFGQDYDINQPTHTFEIKLKPPQKQYSIYDK
jgi:uncharacterized GH25 family protein